MEGTGLVMISILELNRLDFEGQFFGYPFKHASDVIDPEFKYEFGHDFVDPILS